MTALHTRSRGRAALAEATVAPAPDTTEPVAPWTEPSPPLADMRLYDYERYSQLAGPLSDPPEDESTVQYRRPPGARPKRQLAGAVTVLLIQSAFLIWLLMPGHLPAAQPFGAAERRIDCDDRLDISDRAVSVDQRGEPVHRVRAGPGSRADGTEPGYPRGVLDFDRPVPRTAFRAPQDAGSRAQRSVTTVASTYGCSTRGTTRWCA